MYSIKPEVMQVRDTSMELLQSGVDLTRLLNDEKAGEKVSGLEASVVSRN